MFCTDKKSKQVFSGKQSRGGLPVKGKDMRSHCPEGLEYSRYFGIAYIGEERQSSWT